MLTLALLQGKSGRRRREGTEKRRGLRRGGRRKKRGKGGPRNGHDKTPQRKAL